MRLKLIACKVLTREISCALANSANYIDTTFIRRDYHDRPEVLRRVLQDEIDKIDENDDICTHRFQDASQDFDAILLGYGLCSNALLGLVSKKYPLVVPKAHDCVTLFLGSKERYDKEFHSKNGIYWYTKGWIENSLMPSKHSYEIAYHKYVDLYGEDNAEFLLEMEQGWNTKYENCIFISQGMPGEEQDRTFTKECAHFMNWKYGELKGDHTLMDDFINGNWQEDRFLVVPPGKTICASFDHDIVCVGERQTD